MSGLRPRFNQGEKTPLKPVVFLCLKYGISPFTIMMGCIGHPSGWPSLVGSLNLIQPVTQRLRPMGGGYNPNQGEIAMRNHTQKPNQRPEKSGCYQSQQSINKAKTLNQPPKIQKLQSVFNLVKSIKGNKIIVCKALTGEQAISLVTALNNDLNNALLIKFVGMEVVK